MGDVRGGRPKLAVVVVNYGTHRLLERNLVPVSRQAELVVVVDNYSDRVERVAVRRLAAREGWSAIYPGSNVGFGAGMNLGVRAALDHGAQELLLLNPDATIDPTSIARLRERLAHDPKALVAPRVVDRAGRLWSAENDLYLADGSLRATRSRPQHVGEAEVTPWLSGACLMLGRGLWELVGGFDEEYFMYWEDVDLSFRVVQVGGRLLVEETATCVHTRGGSQGVGDGHGKSRLYYYFNIRNRMLFAARHLDQPSRSAWRRASLQQAYRILLRGGRRHLLENGSPLPVAGKAMRDGLRLSRPRAAESQRPLSVMLSFPPPRPTTNPYAVMLADRVAAVPGVHLQHFSWRAALLGRYDVFHVHWPEILVDGRSGARKLVREALFLCLLGKVTVTRTAWVRTVHNLGLPAGISKREVLLLRIAERMTTLSIALNPTIPTPLGRPVETILHGDYTQWFARHPRSEVVPGRIVYFGGIRRHKGLPQLLGAFAQIPDPTLSLQVVGNPSTPDLGAELRALARHDPRVSLDLGFIDDPGLVRAVTAAELVVLPYHEMHNSGAVLTALSLARPVLVPDNDVNRNLADEVGAGWMHLYDGELTADVITHAVLAVRGGCRAECPTFEERQWHRAGVRHVAAYRRAVGLRRGLADRRCGQAGSSAGGAH